MNPILILIFVGCMGGVVRSVLGYTIKEGSKFNMLKFTKSVIRAALAGGAVAFAVSSNPENINTTTYILAFFTAIGADVSLKESYKAIKGGR